MTRISFNVCSIVEALAFAALLVLSGLLIFLALYLPEYLNPSAQSFTVGDVAPVDIVAPSGLSYESEVLTDDRREAAASVVPLRFSRPQTEVSPVRRSKSCVPR